MATSTRRTIPTRGGTVVTGSSTQNPYVNNGGLGYWQDTDLSLNYVRARWLNPATGTWLSRDPVPSEPGYSYVGNRPTTRSDPSGRDAGPLSLEDHLRRALGGSNGPAAVDNKIREVRAQIKVMLQGGRIVFQSLYVIEAVKYLARNLSDQEVKVLDALASVYGVIHSRDKTREYYLNGTRIIHFQDSTAAQRATENQLRVAAININNPVPGAERAPMDWWQAARSFAGTLAIGVGTVMLVGLAAGICPVAAPFIAVFAIGAAVYATIGNMAKRTREAQQAGLPAFAAYFEGLGLGLGSLVGITELVEGGRGQSLTTGRFLTSSESGNEFGIGGGSAALMLAAKPLSLLASYIGAAGRATVEAASTRVRGIITANPRAPFVSDATGGVAYIGNPNAEGVTVRTKGPYVRDDAELANLSGSRNRAIRSLREAVIGKPGTKLRDVYLTDSTNSKGLPSNRYAGFHDPGYDRIAIEDSLTPTQKAQTALHEQTHRLQSRLLERFTSAGPLNPTQVCDALRIRGKQAITALALSSAEITASTLSICTRSFAGSFTSTRVVKSNASAAVPFRWSKRTPIETAVRRLGLPDLL